jgi:hypothetical protein
MTDTPALTGSEALFAALDEAAVKMLKLLDPDAVDTDDENGEPVPVEAATKVKIFEAVVDYTALRAKAEPPKELKASKFDGLRSRFHGDSDETPRRAGRRARTPAATGDA